MYIYIYIFFFFLTDEGHLPESVKLYAFIDSFTMRVRVRLEKNHPGRELGKLKRTGEGKEKGREGERFRGRWGRGRERDR